MSPPYLSPTLGVNVGGNVMADYRMDIMGLQTVKAAHDAADAGSQQTAARGDESETFLGDEVTAAAPADKVSGTQRRAAA